MKSPHLHKNGMLVTSKWCTIKNGIYTDNAGKLFPQCVLPMPIHVGRKHESFLTSVSHLGWPSRAMRLGGLGLNRTSP